MLNNNSALSHLPHPSEDAWLDQVLQYLVDVHTPRMMSDLSFDVMDSRYSVRGVGVWCTFQALTDFFFQDLAINFRGEGFEWRWETFSIGPKQSAEVLSKHLMIPILSTAYLAFISPDTISEISGADLEKVGLNIPTQIMSTLVSDWRGANPLMPYMPYQWGWVNGAHGYDCAGNTLHRAYHRCGSRHLLFLSPLQQIQEIIITSKHPFYRRLTE